MGAWIALLWQSQAAGTTIKDGFEFGTLENGLVLSFLVYVPFLFYLFHLFWVW